MFGGKSFCCSVFRRSFVLEELSAGELCAEDSLLKTLVLEEGWAAQVFLEKRCVRSVRVGRFYAGSFLEEIVCWKRLSAMYALNLAWCWKRLSAGRKFLGTD